MLSEIIHIIRRWMENSLRSAGLHPETNSYITLIISFVVCAVAVFLIQFTVRFILRTIVDNIQERFKVPFLKTLRKRRFLHFLALIAPVTFLANSIPTIFADFPEWIIPLQKVVALYSILMIIWIIMSLLRASMDLLKTKPAFKHKPMESWIQVMYIGLSIIGIIFAYTIITEKNPAALLGILGATSAVLLLMFKDTIMGFVASITVTTNDMVRIGDWITMPEYNADGTVTEISLNAVKIQNFDMTITTIPTYKLIQSSFQNWRGMMNYGGRRIMQSINIAQSSIRFITEKDLNILQKIEGISDYLKEKDLEIQLYNHSKNVNKEILINGRNLTNIGLFRAYSEHYLKNNPNIASDKALMVRQLNPTSKGLPLQIYCFANTIIWKEYENVKADIFDHLFAAVPYFGLQIFEDIHNINLLPLEKLQANNPTLIYF